MRGRFGPPHRRFDLVEVVPCPEDKIDAVVGARVLYKLCGLALRTSSAGRG